MSDEQPSNNDTPQSTGSSWLAAHLSMTIPLLVFIGVLIYVLMQFPSPKPPSGNTAPVWTNPPAGNQNLPANQNTPPSNNEENKPAPDTNKGP